MAEGQSSAGFGARLGEDVLRYVEHRASARMARTVLRQAGRETERAIDEDAPWLSYEQLRGLLEGAAGVLGGSQELAKVMPWVIEQAGPEADVLEAMQGLGSPEALYGAVPIVNDNFMPLMQIVSRCRAARDWTLWATLSEHEWFPELGELISGLFSSQTLLFGLEAAEVTQVAGRQRGGAEGSQCVFRVRWREIEEGVRQRRLAELNARMSAARLARLQRLVEALAAGGRSPEKLLRRVMLSAARAVASPQSLLLVRAGTLGKEPLLLWEGMEADSAERLAGELLERRAPGRPDCLVASMEAEERDFGYLVVLDAGARLFDRAPGLVETYARLAASFLDTRLALGTARALLDLSRAMAELATPDEMALKLARAAPEVSGCERALIYLTELDGSARLAASHGYDERALVALSGLAPGQLPDCASELVEMAAEGEIFGWVLASAGAEASHIQGREEFCERLQGLARQGATAIANARLLERVRHQALHDGLTGLANRSLILDRTERMLARNRRRQLAVAALFIDLDGFKNVNDRLGHEVGDSLLRAVARRLAATIREADTIGRLGGDEFVVLLDGATMDAGPELVAQRLLEVLAEPFETGEGLSGLPVVLGASIGIAVGDRAQAGELLRDADIALHNAKLAGRGHHVVFRPEMQTAVQDRLLLEMDLRDALEAGQFFLVYQPIFNLASGEVTAAEALLRWRHPTRGVVGPDEFIPILEENGSIVQVGDWVLETACREGARIQGQGLALRITVNVSIRQLESEDFVGVVQRVLGATGLGPGSLVLEVTETALVQDVSVVVPRLQAIRALGVRIAIDDFGTGYSSLAYLQQFPVDTIKIDRSFIAAMSRSADSRALVHTLVQLGRTLRLETLAEGIEEREQCSQLRREHCDSGQGYLFARPLSVEELESFMAGHSRPRQVAPSGV